ncbi:MAG: hypothetical protein WDW38_009994 [Sanguina aurantia]
MATTALLLPLATACPQLQHLTVSGRVGSRLLRHFGTSCPHLSCLDAKLTNLSPTTLQALGSLLPKLSSLTAVPRPPLTAGRDRLSDRDKAAEQLADSTALCTALATCPGLVSLDVGSCEVTQAMWRVLPPGLQHLVCYIAQHPAVQGDAWDPAGKRIEPGAGWQAAPGRLPLGQPGLLDARLGAGLVMSGTPVGFERLVSQRGPCEVTVRFDTLSNPHTRAAINFTPDTQPQSMKVFMAKGHMPQTLRNIKDVEFHNEEGRPGLAADLSNLPRVFPNVTTLVVHNMNLKASDAKGLMGCVALSEVAFFTVEGKFEGKELRMCETHPALRKFGLHRCGCIDSADGHGITGPDNKGKLGRVDLFIDHGDKRILGSALANSDVCQES